MSLKEVLYYKQLLVNILNDMNTIESDKANNLTPELTQLKLLGKKIEYKKLIKKIAIIEGKDNTYLETLDEEIITDSIKLVNLKKALGYPTEIRNITIITRKKDLDY